MGAFVPGEVSVRVPATSANLGPGFDALGLALGHHDLVSAEVVPAQVPLEITVEGEGAGSVPLDASHLVYRSLTRGLAELGEPVPTLRLRCRNAVPHGRGLGSSSAAIVAGLALARALVVDGMARWDDDALFAVAAEIEGHPDNVAPAVYGGFTIAYRAADAFRAARLEVDPRVRFVAMVPEEPLATEVARGLLPDVVPHHDAAWNAGRAALLVAALTSRPDLLLEATEDRLHQSFRGPAMPASADLIARLRAGGHAAVVSGAGPTVLTMTDDAALEEVQRQSPPGWRAWTLPVDRDGVTEI